jgi:tRNA threonylcarbamoyl adenosine modification protein YeaZ
MSSTPTTLSLELSQQIASVAMSTPTGRVLELNIDNSCRKEDSVMPSIQKLASELNIAPDSLELVVISIGPGGFTGLRSAVAIAKMISLVSGAAIVPIETALSVAHNANIGPGPYFVVSGVKQDTFWLSKVHNKNNTWFCESAPSSSLELEQSIHTVKALFGDSYLPKSVSALCVSEGIQIHESAVSAKSLLSLGVQLFKNDKDTTVNPLELLPLYPREPEAVRLWKENNKAK